ncbi:anti-phage deoxyguanosine triphosphatase [Candidatus Enterovibrio altilux]|uniref:Deoxyguanosinetriphosphate triphosphohydrolase-like protein n=1 Tax=Candidatus Enterovibrio altilux TaxID=1927128 RepID=A0A291B9W9_9GAMM|nr:anti-phage deoxyguanosine triphosphatase [Candidatus Enterovibrio luxaltus]ATF09785.1 Deoxyguanosinetriphosphate triphosphohydrolase [Candidatus Enterovibrio luxaltus]
MSSEPLSLAWEDRSAFENKQRKHDKRTVFQRDRARILHSAAFRRLQAKTQVLGAEHSEFYRTRLTHSLEVSQIGTGILAQLKDKQPEFRHILPPTSLMESLCLAHDIGHPPYGHGGEIALNYLMRNEDGFEGNAQTFRIVSLLEPYTEFYGMNLTRRTLLGLLKYPAFLRDTCRLKLPPAVTSFRHLKAAEWYPAKGIYHDDSDRFDWVLSGMSATDAVLFTRLKRLPNEVHHGKTTFKSLDCSIMELADEIAYGVHDLEDAIVMGIVQREQWQEAVASKLIECGDPWLEANISNLSEQMFGPHYKRKDAIGALVNTLLTSIAIEPSVQDNMNTFNDPLLQWNASMTDVMHHVLSVLKAFVSKYVVHSSEIQIIEYKGQQLVMGLFDAFDADPKRLLPVTIRDLWLRKVAEGRSGRRVIADYISAMTDGYAQRLHATMFTADSQGTMYHIR